MSTTTTTTPARWRYGLDRTLFAGRPWWEGTAIQFLCRLAAYGGAASLGEEELLVVEWPAEAGVAEPEVKAILRTHCDELRDFLARCPELRFPWWEEEPAAGVDDLAHVPPAADTAASAAYLAGLSVQPKTTTRKDDAR